MVPSGSSTPSVNTLSPFDIIQLHLSSPNDIPVALLYILVYQWGDVLLSLGLQLVFFHVEEVSDGCSTSEPASIATLCDDVAEGVQVYAEQQRVQSISLVDNTLDVQLCNWLGIGLQGYRPHSHWVPNEGSQCPVDVVELQAFQYSCVQQWVVGLLVVNPGGAQIVCLI